MSKVIRYHGTSKDNADHIIVGGFIEDTWFAESLQDAIGYGGPHIFEVAFEEEEVSEKWQFTIPEIIPPEKIITYSLFSRKVILHRPELRLEVAQSNHEVSLEDEDLDFYKEKDF